MSERVPVREDLAAVQPYGAPQVDAPVRLNTNETPYPPPPSFVANLRERIGTLDLHRYPDREHGMLRAALAHRFGLGYDRVWAANGSNEILAQLHQAYGGPGRTVLGTRPGFAALPTIARTTATAHAELPLDDAYRVDVDTAVEAVTAHRPHLVCLARPNNPTGVSVALEVVRALHDASEALIVLDEAYAEFAADDALPLLGELPRLVITRTFSKAFRLAGVRLGYLLGPEWVVDDLHKVRLPYHLDAMTQTAGVVACELADEVTGHIGAIVAERERLAGRLRQLPGVTVSPSDANFLLVHVAADGVFDGLLARGVLVRDFSSAPGLQGCVRITVGTAEECDAAVAALADLLGSELPEG
ncbi:histidinol-phosphate transaminase [Egibacter rhizosphaerae]|uniref:histidinol-phosphate transaminase n=1 Tax=Egibacter rhizosphaerae TaxID=1670831 RepID=UPI00197A8198|nr:histidinol-phosphate transaminase [Egibacter rhizosphaerae]